MKKFGLFGYPLGHSFSARFFNEKFQRENIDATYDNYEIAAIAALPHIVESQPQLLFPTSKPSFPYSTSSAPRPPKLEPSTLSALSVRLKVKSSFGAITLMSSAFERACGLYYTATTSEHSC